MKRSVRLYSVVAVLILSSCGGGDDNNNINRVAKGDVFYGGVFKVNEVEDFRSLFPLNLTDVYSHRIANQVYEGLVKLSQKELLPVQSLAEKWDANDSATIWTFHIRKGVMFHDDPCFPEGKGRELKAQDILYCFTRLCTAAPDNQNFQLTFKNRVKGANEYYKSTEDKNPLKEGVKGFKLLDDYTIQVELNFPFAGFLNILSHPGCWIFPKEAYEKYGREMRVKCVGTGPFRIKNIKEGEVVFLSRNEKYWKHDKHGNQLPYFDAIKVSFIKEKKSELYEFKKGHLDMVFQLPNELIKDVLSEFNQARDENVGFDLQVTPAMNVFYYGFLHTSPVFNNKKVRQAFNYAVDRDKLVTFTLQGEGIPAKYGMVPPAFREYNHEGVKGYLFDPDKARKLMADAGYPNGKGFPKLTLQINSGGGDRNIQTAEVIKKMLKENLNVEVTINVMPIAEHLDVVDAGKVMFWRQAWLADYPDPETFLSLEYGALVPKDQSEKSYVNTSRYVSPEFDSLFVKALREVDLKKRFELYRQADQTGMDDAAYMPIFYDEHYRLIHKSLRNFPINPMEYRDLSEVFFVPEKKKEQKK